MSTAQLKRYIDERTPEERAWIAEYLAWLQRPRKVRDATSAESKRLSPRIEDMEGRRKALSEDEFFARLEAAAARGSQR